VKAPIEICEVASDTERDAVVVLARQIWFEHYPGIISFAQIHYMLERGYTREAIATDQRAGTSWYVAAQCGVPVGFVAFGRAGAVVKVHKVYVARAAKGQGVGRALMELAHRSAASAGCTALVLTVNKNNLDSIRAYLAMGYSFAARVCASIGHGFFMDDYMMRRPIRHVGAPLEDGATVICHAVEAGLPAN